MQLTNGFADVHEWLTAVRNAGIGAGVDRRLLVRGAAGSDEQSTVNDPYGGFTVPAEWSPTLKEVGLFDPTIGLVTTLAMGSSCLKVPARSDKTHTTSLTTHGSQTGGFLVDQKTETQADTATRGVVDLISLEAHTMTGLVYSTNELLEDSPIAAALLIRRGLAQQLGFYLLDKKINGSGSGEPEGILNSPCAISVTRADDDLFDMVGRAWQYDQCIWLANPATFSPKISLSFQTATAGDNFAYTPGNHTICGRPLFLTEFCPDAAATGDVILWQPSEYLLGVRAETFEQSMFVRYAENESAFRFAWRGDGRMWWRSALTPAYSSTKLSPVVVLAA